MKWKGKLGLAILTILLVYIGYSFGPHLSKEHAETTEDDSPRCIQSFELPLQTIPLKESPSTQLDIQIELSFVGELESELKKREGEIRAEIFRYFAKKDLRQFFDDLRQGFDTKDLEVMLNDLLGRRCTETRIIRVNYKSCNFRYMPNFTPITQEVNLTGLEPFSSYDIPTIATITNDAQFPDPPLGSAAADLDYPTLGLFTAPALEWPSRTILLEVDVLCETSIFLEIFEKRATLRHATIKRLTRYPPEELLEKVIDGTLQEELRRIFNKELGYTKVSPIYRVYLPTFFFSTLTDKPTFPTEEKKMFWIKME